MPDANDLPELVAPEEGFSTLSAQITNQAVKRITRIIQKEQKSGSSDEKITRALKRDLSDYDDHTRNLLVKLAKGEEVPDDFPKDNIVEEIQPKPGRLTLKVKQDPPNLRLYSLARYKGSQWLIVGYKDNEWSLKKLD